MSHIHEALQRATRDRTVFADGRAIAEEIFFVAPSPGDAPLTAVDLEEVVGYEWKPSMVSLPTLKDGGDTIEQFRSLRSRVYECNLHAPLKTIVVSSAIPGEGKSFVAANLAISLARNKKQDVLLIDADMRSPSLHGLLGTSVNPGLSEYLTGSKDLSVIIQRRTASSADEKESSTCLRNLFFIPAGNSSEESSEVLASSRFEEMLRVLSAQFSWIIIDSSSVLAFADAVDVARAADAVLLVARSGTTPYDVAQRAKAAMASSRILGFVLNAVKSPAQTCPTYSYER